jgi:hypothetical protein
MSFIYLFCFAHEEPVLKQSLTVYQQLPAQSQYGRRMAASPRHEFLEGINLGYKSNIGVHSVSTVNARPMSIATTIIISISILSVPRLRT